MSRCAVGCAGEGRKQGEMGRSEAKGSYNLANKIKNSSEKKSHRRNNLYKRILKCYEQGMDFFFGFGHVFDFGLSVVNCLLNALRQLSSQQTCLKHIPPWGGGDNNRGVSNEEQKQMKFTVTVAGDGERGRGTRLGTRARGSPYSTVPPNNIPAASPDAQHFYSLHSWQYSPWDLMP